MKIKNKGKVYPSPSSSSSSSSITKPEADDFVSVLQLLPATILALASILSIQDREVLAYMITRSLKTTTSPISKPNPLSHDSKKKRSSSKNAISTDHKNTPFFDCDCFDCYTSYWVRWDSSLNRELIHQVIEAFEEHLSTGESSKKNTKAKRRDKTGRRVSDVDVLVRPNKVQEPDHTTHVVVAADDLSPAERPSSVGEGRVQSVLAEEADDSAMVEGSPPPAAAVNSHKGLARKVLPDVLGLFNSRLWNLWSPNA